MTTCDVHAYQLVVLVDRVIDVDHHELAGQAGEGHQHPKGDTVHTEFKIGIYHIFMYRVKKKTSSWKKGKNLLL